MNSKRYRALFVEETSSHLADMSEALTCLADPGPLEAVRESIDTLFRMIHSIKGMAASLDYEPISSLAHRVEDWLEVSRREGCLPAGGLGLMFEVVSALERMVAAVEGSGGAGVAPGDLVARLDRENREGHPQAGPSRAVGETPTDFVGAERAHSVRVATRVVDRFLAAAGELDQCQSRLEALHRESPSWDLHPELGEELEGMARAVRALKRSALDIRLTPLRHVFERLPHVAARLAEQLGKQVRVECVGEEVEVDRAVLERIDAPLLHLLRNAVDHGIETPQERRERGKPAVGRIRVTASAADGRVRLRIEEDGRGVDLEAVRSRALEAGLLLEQVAYDLPPERFHELLFAPGLSTSREVTSVSGRGVGLDVVKRRVESLGGSVSVESRPGLGSAFEIEVPSLVALQRVLVLELCGERVLLPLAPVRAVVRIAEGEVERSGGDTFFVWRDEPIPLVDLAEKLGLAKAERDDRGDVVLLEAQGLRLGLRADRAAIDREVFVREVPELLSQIPSLAGVAMLPDGVPAFLLETASLVEQFV